MSALASRSDEALREAGDPLASIRARGLISLTTAAHGGVTRRARVREEGALRLRFPREARDRLDAVLVNVAGGMAGGDVFGVSLSAGEGARLMVTTAAAEKVYRALGRETVANFALEAGEGASLAFLPQETILFDRVRLSRRFDLAMHASARLIACDLTILGRAAMGEDVRSLWLNDQWRLRRAGKLIWADAMRIDGDAQQQLAALATGGGARAFGSLLYAAPDAARHLEALRASLSAAPGCEAAATSFDGLLVARFMAHDGAGARAAMARALALLPDAAPPRSWST